MVEQVKPGFTNYQPRGLYIKRIKKTSQILAIFLLNFEKKKEKRIPNLFKILLKLLKIFILFKKSSKKTNNEATIYQNP